MLRLFVILCILIVTVKCNFCCKTCKCSRIEGAYYVANCPEMEYKSEILKSSDINFGVNTVHLYMNKIPIKVLPNYVFANANIGNLKLLELKSCGITTIEKEAFGKLSELRFLNIAHNNIAFLSLGTFQDNWKLKELYCEGNKLEVLEDGLLEKLSFLEKVSFQNNLISQIGENFFVPNFMLKEILLSNNLLSYINGKMFAQLRNLQKLSVSHNPWKCDCKLRNFQEMSRKYDLAGAPDCNNANNPENVRNIHWDALNTDDFTCEPVITLTSIPDLKSTSWVTILCEVTANPEPFATFFKVNQNSINTVQKKPDYTYIYKYDIEDINTDINSTYKCSAYNKLGTAEKNITITQSLIKSILKYAEVGHNLTLQCTHFTDKKASINWYFNNNTIEDNTNKYEIKTLNSNITIRNLQLNDSGLYKCTDSKEIQYFKVIVEPKDTIQQSGLSSTIILCIILTIIVLIFTITLLYFKWRCRNQKEQSKCLGNEMSKMKTTNDYVENTNGHFEESCIYISSDNNIYEDIK